MNFLLLENDWNFTLSTAVTVYTSWKYAELLPASCNCDWNFGTHKSWNLQIWRSEVSAMKIMYNEKLHWSGPVLQNTQSAEIFSMRNVFAFLYVLCAAGTISEWRWTNWELTEKEKLTSLDIHKKKSTAATSASDCW